MSEIHRSVILGIEAIKADSFYVVSYWIAAVFSGLIAISLISIIIENRFISLKSKLQVCFLAIIIIPIGLIPIINVVAIGYVVFAILLFGISEEA